MVFSKRMATKRRGKLVFRRKRRPYSRGLGLVQNVRLAERKFLDTETSMTYLDTGSWGIIKSLNLLAQSGSTSGRIGAKVCVKSVELIVNINVSQQTLADAAIDEMVVPHFAIMLVLDRQPNGALPAITDILKSDALSAYPLIDNTSRFTIIRRKDFPTVAPNFGLNVAGTANLVGRVDHPLWHFYKKLNLPIRYGGTTAVIDNVKTNNLVLCCYQSNVDNQSSTLFVNARIRYTDA